MGGVWLGRMPCREALLRGCRGLMLRGSRGLAQRGRCALGPGLTLSTGPCFRFQGAHKVSLLSSLDPVDGPLFSGAHKVRRVYAADGVT